MMEKNVALKYWREVVSKTFYTFNRVKIKKVINATLFEIWYGHSPNVKHFKVLGCKCYILKESRNGKFDAKFDEGIFLGYSTRSKASKCLNVNTNKIMESANDNIDEHIEIKDNEFIKKPEEYKYFFYFYEGMPIEEEVSNQVGNQQV